MSVPFDPATGNPTSVGPARFEPTFTLDLPELPELDLTDFTEDIERIEAASYTGYDPDHLATAIVDGTGLVSRIRLATSVGSRAPEAVEKAIVAAVAAAQAELGKAWLQLAERAQPAAPPQDQQKLPTGLEHVVDPDGQENDHAA